MQDRHGRQDGHLVRCEWGAAGAQHVGGDGAVVVVDVLSFTTSVCVLVERGTRVHPCAWGDARAVQLAQERGAALAVGRRQVSVDRPWSLSPAALLAAPAPDRLVLPSPNGSAVAASARGEVVAACLRNAAAVGGWLSGQGYGTDRPVTLVPAGERWPDGSLRPALEDLLGAGLVLSSLRVADDALSPEALAARSLARGLAPEALVALVRGCASGRELVDSGFPQDVDVAVDLDASDVVPVLSDGCFGPARG